MASSRSWVTWIAVKPSRLCSALISSRSCTRTLASRLDSGSSSSRSGGSIASARPSATRWRWPPDRFVTLRSSSPERLSIRRSAPTRAAHLGARHAAQPQAVADIAEHGHVRPQRVGLEHHRDAALLGREAGDVAAEEPDRAGRRLLEAGDGAQQRGLAAAGGAEDRDEFARRDGEVDAAQDGLRPVADLEAVDLDRERFWHGHDPAPVTRRPRAAGSRAARRWLPGSGAPRTRYAR